MQNPNRFTGNQYKQAFTANKYAQAGGKIIRAAIEGAAIGRLGNVAKSPTVGKIIRNAVAGGATGVIGRAATKMAQSQLNKKK